MNEIVINFPKAFTVNLRQLDLLRGTINEYMTDFDHYVLVDINCVCFRRVFDMDLQAPAIENV